MIISRTWAVAPRPGSELPTAVSLKTLWTRVCMCPFSSWCGFGALICKANTKLAHDY